MVSNSGVNTGCDKDGISTHPATIQTKLRLYLPPPIVKAIRDIDPQLEPYIGAEGCVNIFGTVCIGWIIYQLGRFFSRGGSGGSSTSSLRGIEAIQDNDNDCALMRSNETSSVSFDETVLFCGPSLGGKTSLFYRLVQQKQTDNAENSCRNLLKTVRSIKLNTGVLKTITIGGSTGASNNHDPKVVRILDTPAHWGPQKLLQVIPLKQMNRLVVVVDSTQSVAPAADYIYSIIKKSNYNQSGSILISCHKSDHPKAKNARRIKLQLRSELVRLSKLDDSAEDNDNWENMLNTIPFCSSNINDLEDVRKFCVGDSIK